MAKRVYKNINGVARRCQKMYPGVDAVSRKTKKGYIGVNGVARQFFQSEIRMSDLSVGSSVYMNVNGVRTEFLIVNKGLPSSAYDSSCNGTWLLMKDIYTIDAWDRADNGYNNHYNDALINTLTLNSIFNRLDSDIQDIIVEAKIPYTYFADGSYDSGELRSGASGLSSRLFLLSYAEVGFTTSSVSMTTEGTRLSYFSSGHGTTADNKRLAYHNGTATSWWLRSPSAIGYGSIAYVGTNGDYNTANNYTTYGVRPALIIPSTTLCDENFNILV